MRVDPQEIDKYYTHNELMIVLADQTFKYRDLNPFKGRRIRIYKSFHT